MITPAPRFASIARNIAALTTLAVAAACFAGTPPQSGLLFHLSGDHGTKADFSAGATPAPTYENQITQIADGAVGGALECGNLQLLAYRAPGNIYAQRGTFSFFWRSRYPVGPTAFPLFRVGYADHSSWDMVFLRIDYNGHGFDAFVTDASLSRTRVSFTMPEFPGPKTWTHLAFSWDENRGVRLYVNGKLAASADAKARYDLALDQFGPHSRVISPYQVQSDYNFVRGGDIDEVRIYDHMLDDAAVAALAKADTAQDQPAAATRTLPDSAVRDEWYLRYGWTREAPPELPAGTHASIRKVEIHNAYDMKRWWWKATDGIRETTWPGVYNRSRLPGRNDYFQLPDWDCYVESGKAVTFAPADEPWNQIEISGAAWGRMDLLKPAPDIENAYLAPAESQLFERRKGVEHSVHRLRAPITGRWIRFTNVEQEQPIGELVAYNVGSAPEPAGSRKLAFKLTPSGGRAGTPALAALENYIDGRFPADERARLVASTEPAATDVPAATATPGLPIAHILIPDTWDALADGLDGIALDLPAFGFKPTHGGVIGFNIQVKDPLWPGRDMLDFTFGVKPGQAKTLWLDLRDRILPDGKPVWITIASSSPEFNERALAGAEVRLVFKPRDAARAEHELDRFTQVRDVYAMLLEERPSNPRLDMFNRFKGDLEDLLRVNPDHVLGRQYSFAGVRGPMGGKRPDYTAPEVPVGIPAWAFRQVTLLGQVKDFVTWYIDHRQVPYGDFGGGISDDVDLVNHWAGVALMGCEPDKITASLNALLDAAYRNGMFTQGLPTIQADELHSYEEGINTLAQSLVLDFGSPRQLERAMETARGVESITGINAAGHRHIRSSYYSGTKVAEEDPWGYAKPYSYLVLDVPQALVTFNGNPRAKKYLLELADGLLAHRRATPAPGSVPAIRFIDDHEERVGRSYFPAHVFWGAYQYTGDRRYLAPLLESPATLVQLNANVLDWLDLRSELGPRVAAPKASATPDRKAGDAGGRPGLGGHLAWQLTGDKSQLERLYAQQCESTTLMSYINTEGSLWIDRVSVPTADLQRARLGGVALTRNSLFPGHAISWRFAAPATGQSVAILVPHASATELKVILFNLEATPVRAAMTGWNIDPGTWEIAQGVDVNDDDEPDGNVAKRTAVFERSRSLDFVLPPRATTILNLKLATPGTPYWDRPDLGIDDQDVSVNRRTVKVRVHGLGSIASPATTLAIRDASGRVLGSTAVPALDAPIDLRPKFVDVEVTLPRGTSTNGISVELDPDHRIEEITRMNNLVRR